MHSVSSFIWHIFSMFCVNHACQKLAQNAENKVLDHPSSKSRKTKLTLYEGHEDCKRVKWKYMQFLCGNDHLCMKHSQEDKRKAAEIAKANIVNRFYVIGILEQFIDTLNLFDTIMPRYYKR